ELVERLGDLRLFRNSYILPDLAVGKRHFAPDRSVGIDGVAGVQQKIRSMPAHGGEGEHAAVIRVDAPALSGDVASPDEADVAPIGRRGAKAPEPRLPPDVFSPQLAKPPAAGDTP